MDSGKVYAPTVSVIVPVLNAKATIRDLLDSLVELDYDKDKLEVIMVDGGSTDGTTEIIESYPVKLVLERRKGLNVARNAGLRESQGEIAVFTDSDCVVPPDWVRKMVRNFEAQEIGCAGGNASRYEDTFLSRYADNSVMPILRRFKKDEVLSDVEPPLRYPAGCNMAFRRDAIEKVNGFNESIHYGFDEDELVERLCRAGYKLALDPEATVKHQHRATLEGILRQTFNYGRGGALLIKKKRTGDRIARWNLITLMLFAAWLTLSFSSLFLAATRSLVFVLPPLAVTFTPIALLTFFYAYRTLETKDYVTAVAYPIMDLLRFIAYCMGEVYGLVR